MKHCLECKIQGQERETKDFTILPVAKYAYHKQAGINMDEHFYITKNRDSKKKYSEAVPLSFANSPLPSFHKEETDRQEQLNVKNFQVSEYPPEKQLPPTEKSLDFN